MKTVCLISAYNEEYTIAKVILDCRDYSEKVLVCDDGSTDSTFRIAKGLLGEENVIHHENNLGKGAALRDLFRKASAMGADIVVTVDADGQHDPRDIPVLVRALDEADMVIGGRQGIPTIRAAGNLMLNGFEGMDVQSGFRAYRGSVLQEIVPTELGISADSEIFMAARRLGIRITQVPVQADYSVPHPSKKNLVSHFLAVLLNVGKLIVVSHPLRTFGGFGALLVLAAAYFGLKGAQYLQTEGLGSIILLIVGLFFLSTAIQIAVNASANKRDRGAVG